MLLTSAGHDLIIYLTPPPNNVLVYPSAHSHTANNTKAYPAFNASSQLATCQHLLTLTTYSQLQYLSRYSAGMKPCGIIQTPMEGPSYWMVEAFAPAEFMLYARQN